jgi:opacity protein-like surface antigen
MRIQSILISATACFACLTAAASAAAEPETHDGFFLRMELGAGYLMMPGTLEGGSSSLDVDISGMGGLGGLLLGGTPADGLVIGGGSLASVVSKPTIKVGDFEDEADDDLSLSLLGPFVQYYPDPTGGLHFELLLGYASASGTDDDADEAATGFGVSAGVGHEWWVSEEWSLGVAGRFHYANVKYESDSGNTTITQKYNAMVPGVVFTATYH